MNYIFVRKNKTEDMFNVDFLIQLDFSLQGRRIDSRVLEKRICSSMLIGFYAFRLTSFDIKINVFKYKQIVNKGC